jgi:hypothetical protein
LIICGCRIAGDTASAFSRLRGLKEIHIPFLKDPRVLSAIGRNLVSLSLFNPSKEVASGIVESCPNLQYLTLECLELEGVEWEEDDLAELKLSLKHGLKKLAKLDVNERVIRLGTDWEGYPEENEGGEA